MKLTVEQIRKVVEAAETVKRHKLEGASLSFKDRVAALDTADANKVANALKVLTDHAAALNKVEVKVA